MADLWDIYDENRVKTGRTVERGQPMESGGFHLVVDIWMRNPRGEWLISKRTPNKNFPLMWETTGGSAVAGEDSLTAALREVKEELGVDLNPSDGRLFRSIRRYDCEWPDFVDIWVFACNAPIESIVFQPEETCDAMWATKEQIYALLDRGEFIPRDVIPCIDELLESES
jgi:8-oxo-dGTP pyrophosphatase MutT (NUDIX family)